jgi:phosphatidylserine/phosphatidylglycerophosphate/cardiolipin synthase-like enzyme
VGWAILSRPNEKSGAKKLLLEETAPLHRFMPQPPGIRPSLCELSGSRTPPRTIPSEVLEERLRKAEKSILIAVYEFTAPHVKDMILKAVGRGVKVTLLLGAEYHDQRVKPDFIEQFAKAGVEVVKAPSGKGRTFLADHPKLIVIDRTWPWSRPAISPPRAFRLRWKSRATEIQGSPWNPQSWRSTSPGYCRRTGDCFDN